MNIKNLYQALISETYTVPAHIILPWDDRELYTKHLTTLSEAKKTAFANRLAFFEKITNNTHHPVAVIICPFGSFFVGIYNVINTRIKKEFFRLCTFSGNDKVSSNRIRDPFKSAYAIEIDELAYYISRLFYYQERVILKANPFKVGDVLYSTWGYEQTNCNFFKVLSLTPKQVTLVEIEGERIIKDMKGYMIPLTHEYRGEQFTRKVQVDSVRINDTYGFARKLGFTVKYGVTIYDSVGTCYA